MIKNLFHYSRLNCLLFLIVVLPFSSCKKEQETTNFLKDKLIDNALQEEFLTKDSLSISMIFVNKSKTGFNMADRYLRSNYLNFVNRSEKDTVIVKNILKIYDNQVLYFGGGRLVDGSVKLFHHYYLIDKSISSLRFEYDNGDVHLKSNTDNCSVDDLFRDYKKLGLKLSKSKTKKQLEKELDSLHHFYQQQYTAVGKKLHARLNDYHYINTLQKLYPLDKRVEDYIKELKDPIGGKPLGFLIYFYVKNRIATFNFDQLNTQNYSPQYIDLLTNGVFDFLRDTENEGSKYFSPAYKWLQGTALYKAHKVEIDSQIIRIDKQEFTKKLKNLKLFDHSFGELSFAEVVKQHPSNYYLIDFWATWCAPCIDGMKTMKKMDMPNTIAIISISVDKTDDKDKWKTKSSELELTASYFLEKNSANKEFLKMIELQSIPRYLVVDKNLNLVALDFFHPSEPDFLRKLQEITYTDSRE